MGCRYAFVLSDEVYESLVFGGRRHAGILSNARLRERAFAVFSFGKIYNACSDGKRQARYAVSAVVRASKPHGG